MKKILLVLVFVSYSNYSPSQTALTDANIHEAAQLWLDDPTAAEAIYGHISDWCTSNVTNMSKLFQEDPYFPTFNENIGNWDVSNVTNMEFMFDGASLFNQDISNWDVSNVTNMRLMFSEARQFNQPIGNWNVSKVKTMKGMFINSSFNGNIGNWDVSNVTDMSGMFREAYFNRDIGIWDVSNVTDMNGMFYGNYNFDQPIGDWDVSKVTKMESMFYLATSFDQDIGDWNVSNVTTMEQILGEADAFSDENYDKLLIGWATRTLQPNVSFRANFASYCLGEDARNHIINTYNWQIEDAGKDCTPLRNQDSLADNISMYPNPTISTITLKSNFNSNYTIFSSSGKTLSNGYLKVGENDISLINYPTGVYFLKINSEKGTVTKQIVKL